MAENDRWDSEFDVVIAGAGGAGLAAAIEAAEAEARTVVFEKQGKIWESSTAINVGMVAFAGTDVQQRLGIEDSSELLYQDLLAVGNNKNDPSLVRAYADHQLDTYRWLKDIGVRWAEIATAAAGMSRPRGHFSDPLDMVRILKRQAEQRGATVLFHSAITELITDNQQRVIGVQMRDRVNETRIRARRGVVLATGGFARSADRLAALDRRFVGLAATTGLGHTGDHLRMAEPLGAYFCDMEYVKPSYELHVTGDSAAEICLIFYLGAIIVNRQGRRFVNESIPYKDIGMASLDQPDGVGVMVFDQKIFDRALDNTQKASSVIPSENVVLGLDAARIRLLVQADTIEELADGIHIPRQVLKETVERYNNSVASGADTEFGRSHLSASIGSPVRIETPPFYAYEAKSHFLATYAGLAVDASMRVLTHAGHIPGLYAAGEAIGGFHGASYHSGAAVGQALIFGRIAGRNAAQGS
ncbi:MAG: FAD-dependent oxidoreductase [Acidimicrobiia bacterium]|nr:FAD-dependent oxidoreductase [Acidimicrobiia bacterium]